MAFPANQFITNELRHEISQVLDSLSASKERPLALHQIYKNKILKQFLNNGGALNKLSVYLKNELYNIAQAGYVRFDLTSLRETPYHIQDIATLLCCCAGTPILLYNKEPFWEPLTVKLEALPNRTHGVGLNPMHIDLMNRSRPPEIIAFLGVRPDPLGGGFTELANLFTAIKVLNEAEYQLLSQPIFTYWKDEGVCHVGENMDYFPIIPEDLHDGYIRFTAKMIPHLDNSDTVIRTGMVKFTKEIKMALEKIYADLQKHKIRFLVEKDHLVFFNQRFLAHSRAELGKEQASLPSDKRRLMLQAYMHRPQ